MSKLSREITEMEMPEALSAEEEREAFWAFWNGDMEARQKLIRHNLRLIIYVICNHYYISNEYVEADDLFQIGVGVLIKCVDVFDVTKGYKFSNYFYKSLIRMFNRCINVAEKKSTLDFSQMFMESEKNNDLIDNLLIDKSSSVENKLGFNDLKILNKYLSDLDYITSGLLKMRFGLDGKEPLTLNEIYNEVPFSHLEIFLIIKRGLYLIQNSINKEEFVEDTSVIDKDTVKNLFEQFRSERLNNNPFCVDVMNSLNEEDLKQLYLKKDLYEEIIKYLRLIKDKNRLALMKYVGMGYYDAVCDIKELRENGDPSASYHLNTCYKQIADGIRIGHFVNTRLKTIYEVFSDYTKDEVNEVIYELSSEEILFLYEVFGTNFSHYYRTDMVRGKKMLKLFEKIEKRLKKKRFIISIQSIFPEFSLSEIRLAVDDLNYDLKCKLFLNMGFNFPNLKENLSADLKKAIEKNLREFRENVSQEKGILKYFEKKYGKLKPDSKERLKMYLENDFSYEELSKLFLSLKLDMYNKLQHGKNVKNIYELCDGYTKEQIDFVISTLTEEERLMIFRKFGFDLEHPNIKEWDISFNRRFYYILIPKIKSRLEKLGKNQKKSKAIDELFQGFTHLEIVIAISMLPLEFSEILLKCYGAGYNNYFCDSITTLEHKVFRDKVVPRLSVLLNKFKNGKARKPIKIIYDYYPDVPRSVVNHAIRLLDTSERELFDIRNGIDLDNPVSIEEWFIDSEKNSSLYRTVVRHIGRNIKYLLDDAFDLSEKTKTMGLKQKVPSR